ncbi:MAG: putative amidohydrolase YtcJ [Cellvibrionaceae bacterium]|jgi:predicted amidohydrolase YtcJ
MSKNRYSTSWPLLVGFSLLILLAACLPKESLETDVNDPESETYLPILVAKVDAADTIYHNGIILTINKAQPKAQAVAVKEGVIIAVGSDAEVLAFAGDTTQIIDLKEAMMLPGFQDPHLHVLEAGLNETLCLVSDFATLDEYADEIWDCAQQQPGTGWVRAAGANMSNLLDQTDMLPIELLDDVIPDRPVIVLDDLGHGAWANTLAFKAVGYDRLKGDPPGGILVRDPDSGALTGVVLENGQQALRTASLPPTAENIELAYQGLLVGLETVAQNGITTVSDAGGYWTRGHQLAWQRAEAKDTLTARASNALYLFPDLDFNQQLADITANYSDDPDSLLRFNQVKIYIDGILSQGTGALLKPYQQDFGIPGVPNDGFLYFDVETLNEYAREFAAAGFQMHFHVTGDRGARIALDAIEQSSADSANITNARHRLTHLYLLDEADRGRFAPLNVVADFQFSVASVEDEYIDFMVPFIGNRVDQLLPLFEMVESGAHVTLSSDYDADDLSPLAKIATVLQYDEAENLTVEDIVRLMTLNVAYLLHQEDSTGSIEVGKLADLVVLNQDITAISIRNIGRTKVLLTILEGEEVYRSPAAPE